MTKLLTAVRQIRNFLILFLLLFTMGTPVFAALSCRSVFDDSNMTWPPPSWKAFLKTLPMPAVVAQPMAQIPRQVVEAPREDSRLYTHGSVYLADSKTTEFGRLSTPKYVEKDILQEVKSSGGRYEYLESENPQGGPYTIKPAELGHAITVYDLPRRNEFPSQSEYNISLNKYLDRIVGIVKEGKTYPEYDAIFDRRRLEWDAEDRAKIASGRSISRKHRFGKESRVTSFPVEIIPETGMARMAFREEYDRGDMVVTLISTKWVGHVQTTPEQIQFGRGQQKNWVIDLVSEVYPDYVERRHWSESFIKADFTEVLETLNSTDYVMVREKDAAGKPGALLAAMGLNRASYGKAQYFHAEQNQWVEMTGKFGSTVHDDYPTAQSVQPIDPAILREGPVPILKMESYLGQDFRMPRPSVVEGVTIKQIGTRFTNGEFVGKQPVYMSAGEIFEPVKFYMSRTDARRAAALTEVFSSTINTMFRFNRSCDISGCGQALYTFNPKTEGSRLYAKRGMGLMTQFPSADKDGVDWHVFGSTVDSYLQKYHEPSQQEKAEEKASVKKIESTRSLIEAVQTYLNRK